MQGLKPRLGFNLQHPQHRYVQHPHCPPGARERVCSRPASLKRNVPGSLHTFSLNGPHTRKEPWRPAHRIPAPLDSSPDSGSHVQGLQQGLQQLLGRAVGALIAASICISGVPFVAPAQAAKLTPDEMSTIKVFNTSKPSVVSVTNLALRRDAFTMNMMEMPQGVGSGFIWDEEGHVVTNYHVINDSANVKVTLGTDELLATVVGVDPDKDVAVLQVLPATISQDPTNNNKKDPKSVGTSFSRLPALSDVDWAPSSSSSSRYLEASVDDIISRASTRTAASLGGSSSINSEFSDVVSTSATSRLGAMSDGWSGQREGTEGPASASSNAAVSTNDRWGVVSSSSSSSSSIGGWDGVTLVETSVLPTGGAELQGQQQNAFAPEPTLKKPPAPPLPEGEGTNMVLNMPEAMETMRPLCLASSKDLMVGQKVYAVGNPFGLDHTLTMGVVSGTGREIQSLTGRPINEVIQTDAAINPGNSGGPLLDSSGCVIGITTAIYSSSGQNSGVGFAIPTDVIRVSVEQILKYGKVVRPIVGITFAPDQGQDPGCSLFCSNLGTGMNPASEQLGVKGIMVLNAVEGGPAWKAGIQGTSRDEFGRLVLGDIIRGANGQPVRSAADLYKQLDKSKVGDQIDLEVLRGSSIQHVGVTLEANQAPPSQNIVIMAPVPVPMPEP